MEHILAAISHYGYAGLFAALLLGIVGVPLPDETILVFCGYLIASGRMHPVPAFLAAVAGSISGISLSYVLGRTLGHRMVVRYGRYIHLTQTRLERVHAWFARIGNWVLTFGYFILGVRHFTALVAGLSELEFGVFARYAWSGAVLWVATFLTLGYIVGDNWRNAIVFVHHYTWAFAGIMAAAAVLVLLSWWARQRRQPARLD